MSSEPDQMILQLFRSEVESHSETLTSSLLALEQDPTATTNLERMMRAAHSIKGAARIVRVDSAADVAHVMEDCFVAAQNGKLSITPDDVDILLRGVDLLGKLSAATSDPQTDWASFQGPVADLVGALRGVLQGRGDAGSRDVAVPTAIAPPALAEPSSVASPAPVARRPLAVVVCPKVLDSPSAEQARHELLSALESGVVEIDIDLRATTDMDAVGLAFLALAGQHGAARSGSVRFHPISTELETILQLIGLDAAATGAAVT